MFWTLMFPFPNLLFGEGWSPTVAAGAPFENITFPNGFHRSPLLIRTSTGWTGTQRQFGGKRETLIFCRILHILGIMLPFFTVPCRAKQ